MNEQFFQFSNNPQPQFTIETSPVLNHNIMALEISNNWIFVKDLIKRIKDNTVEKVDNLEQDWLNFINNNQIDIDAYQESSEFLVNHIKSFES